MSEILLSGKDFPYQDKKTEGEDKPQWTCYESKAGVPILDVDGNKFTERDGLREGMEVFSKHFLTNHEFKAIVCRVGDGRVVADDGANIYSLVFEEGFWGYISAFNKKAVRYEEEEKHGKLS